MNKCKLAAVGTPLALCALVTLPQSATADTPSIICNTENVPTVRAMAFSQNSSVDVSILSFLPEYFSPQEAVENCQNTAKSLQELYQSDRGNYLVSDRLNDQPVVCAVERRGLGCDSYSAQLLFTLDRETNPSEALYAMLGSDFKQAQSLNTRTVSRIYTNLKPSWWQSFWLR